MEWLIVIINAVAVILLGLFIKHYLPGYMAKKGENLATKEDVTEITRRTEEVQEEFRKDLEKFSSDIHFKYDFYYRQYTILYTKLYSIICQSEYTRRFFKLLNGTDFTVEEVPFVEIHKGRTHDIIKFGKEQSFTHTEETLKDAITQFCKKEMCELIIENGEFATQKLLKLSVAYLFVYDNYSGNEEANGSEATDVANSEEFILIREMVRTIIQEYNFLRKELRMEYVQSELESGIFENINLSDCKGY